ncbi:MAG TPA: ClbS/DfsB family four-helix bundle protein [Anaerolineales bacterium]|nr:ClbS/DfsB family four-helix bundle protein [Anaerolineales bacterium]
MPITKQRALDYMEFEWGTYAERFQRLPQEAQRSRLKEMGYESLRDMLAHILAWWEEGLGIIRAIAEERSFQRRKYDFDVFNAEAVAKYKPWDEAEFMAHFEKTRQNIRAELGSMKETVFENRRVRGWLHAVILHHAREHLVTVSRFLPLDMLKNDWASYIVDFNCLEPEEKKDFLSKQGWASFHDLLAHIVGWWEETARITNGILDSPAFTWQNQETDAFNVELTKKFSAWPDEDLFKHYETVRLALIDLVEDLPEDAFLNQEIESRLASDVVGHYDDHPIPA